MRYLLPILALATLVAACGGSSQQTGSSSEGKPKAHPAFPDNYESWRSVNDEPLVRKDEGVVRELYARVQGELDRGTVLVKEEHKLMTGDKKGKLDRIAMMKRTGGSANDGWKFMAFRPETHERVPDDDTACVSCHELSSTGDDMLWTPRSKILQ